MAPITSTMEVDGADNSPTNVSHSNGSKKPRLDNTGIVEKNVPTSNAFAPLANNGGDTGAQNSNATRGSANDTDDIVLRRSAIQSTNNKRRSPPVTVVGKKRSEVISLCEDNDIKNYRLKLTSEGINIYTDDETSFKKLRATIKEQGTSFYTHDHQADRQFRVLLKGLFSMESDQLKQELIVAGLQPISARGINPRKRKYDDQMLFIVEFPKGSTSVKKLRDTCKYLFYVKVSWEAYAPKRFGPTLCRRCQRYGHGYRNCCMPLRCRLCSSSHEEKDCSLVVNGTLVEGATLKCAGCGEAHPADHQECKKLIEYLRIQEQLTRQNAAKNRRPKPAPAVNMNPSNFPSLPSRSTPVATQQRQNQNADRPTINYADVLTSGSNSCLQKSRGSRTRIRQGLLSPDELLQMSADVLETLRSSHTVEEQFFAIVRLSLKYVYEDADGHP